MNKATNAYCPTGEIEKIFVNCIWKLSESIMHERKEIILPKGTVEIIFNFSEPIRYINPSLKISSVLPSVFINGINFKPFELLKTGRQEFLGIQINAIGLRLLFDIPAVELNNGVYEGKYVCTQLNSLYEKLFCAQSFYRQVDIILAWIRKRVPVLDCKHSVDRARKLLNENCGNGQSVKQLSEALCLSDRQLRRFCRDWLGMNTEDFIHYNRYLRSLHLLHHSSQCLTRVGIDSGYFDQSHFIREFRFYTGMTPRQYRLANKELPGHIFI